MEVGRGSDDSEDGSLSPLGIGDGSIAPSVDDAVLDDFFNSVGLSQLGADIEAHVVGDLSPQEQSCAPTPETIADNGTPPPKLPSRPAIWPFDWLLTRLEPILEAKNMGYLLRNAVSRDDRVKLMKESCLVDIFPKDMKSIVTAHAFFAAIGKPVPPPQEKKSENYAAGGSGVKKMRGKYDCPLCGQPKAGHACPFLDGPKLTKGTDTGTQTDQVDTPDSKIPFGSGERVLAVHRRDINDNSAASTR